MPNPHENTKESRRKFFACFLNILLMKKRFGSIWLQGRKKNLLGRNLISKSLVVLDKQHGWPVLQQKIPDLHARKYINEVQGFIPDIKMRLFAKAACKQHFFLLSGAESFHILLE